MKLHDSIIFDLDGTLWDTSASCATAWNNVLQRHNIAFRKITPADIKNVTGKTHEICVRETFKGLPESQIILISEETAKEDNIVVATQGGHIYEGVHEGLQALEKEFPLFIVSNCQSGYIETFLKFSGYQNLFTDIECWGNTNKPKSENIKSIITRNNLKSPIYIGDTEGDRSAAMACNIPFYYVEYGFGNLEDQPFSFLNFKDLATNLLEK